MSGWYGSSGGWSSAASSAPKPSTGGAAQSRGSAGAPSAAPGVGGSAGSYGSARRPVAAAGTSSATDARAASTGGGRRQLPGQGSAAGGGGASAASGPKPALTVSTQSKRDEIGIQTLVGDYVEMGMNHEKKYFQKIQKIPGHEHIKVYLYYWDARDGEDFSGWWFGDQLGGSQVWARSNSHADMPPRSGWRIPWDAPRVEMGLLFVDAYQAAPPGAAGRPSSEPPPAAPSRASAPPAAGSAGLRPAGSLTPRGSGAPPPSPAPPPPGQSNAPSLAALRDRVKQAGIRVSAVERATEGFVEKAKALTVSNKESEFTQVQLLLQKQQAAVGELQKSLTQDINEIRKAGVAATGPTTEMSKLSPRIRTLQTTLGAELARIKKLAQEATVHAKKQAELEVQEEADLKELQELIPTVQEQVNFAEDSVEVVVQMSQPLLDEPPEDSAGSGALEEVEGAATDAQHKVTEARRTVTAKLQEAKRFAPETRKKALAEFTAMQQKLTEVQKKLNPFKNFQKEFHVRVEARKALREIGSKLEAAEVEIEKATMMSLAAEQGQMSEDELNALEKVLKPAQQALAVAAKQLDLKLRSNEAGTSTDVTKKDELRKQKERAAAAAEAVVATLRKQREGLSAKEMVNTAADKVDRVEEALAVCQDAEMPFLKGIEILPPDESSKAIGDCEAASSKVDTAINQARSALRARLGDAKRYEASLAARTTEELKFQEKRLEAAAKKLAAFKKDTVERKTAALLAEARDAVSLADTKVSALAKACEAVSNGNIEELTAEALKDLVTKAVELEQAASTAVTEAKRTLSAKQREDRAGETSTALSKLQTRLSTASAELNKHRKMSSVGERLLRGKEVLVEHGAKVSKLEADVQEAERTAKPENGAEPATDEAIEKVGASMTEAQKTLKVSSKAVELSLPGAPPALRTAAQKLLDRCKAVQERVAAVLAATRERRERALGASAVREGEAIAEDVEAALRKLDEVELPFLKGVEVLPLEETRDTIAQSVTAALATQNVIGKLTTFIASKSLEVKQFGEAASKPTLEQLAKLTEKTNAASSKLSQFKKDTEVRKKAMLMQEAAEKATKAEEVVKQIAEAVAPFMKEGVEALSAEDAARLCEALIEQLRACSKSIEDAKLAIAARQKDARANPAQAEALDKHKARLKEAEAELAKHRKVASLHEQKYVATKLLAQFEEQIAASEAELAKATEACAPLLQQGGEKFLVANSVETLANALRKHMEEKGLTEEALFSEVAGGGAGPVSEEAFSAWLDRFVAAGAGDEVNFPAPRRAAVFRHLCASNGGTGLQPADLAAIFRRQYVCIKDVSVTDKFAIKESKTVAKIEKGEALESIGASKSDGSLTRLECRVLSSGKTGFVTLSGNSGTVFVEQVSPFAQFCAEMDRTLLNAVKGATKLVNGLDVKTKELATAKEGPLNEARENLLKLKPRITAAHSALEQLKKQAVAAKKTFAKQEEAEKTAHIEAKERKEAEALTSGATAKVEAMEAAAKALEEAAKPLASLEGAALLAFPTPVSTLADVERLLKDANARVKEAKETVTEQHGSLPKGQLKGPLLEAKKELTKLASKVDSVKRQCAAAAEKARAASQHLAQAKRGEVSALLRSHVQKRGIQLEQLFMEVVTPGDDRISEAAFSKYVTSLGAGPFEAEHLKLLCNHIEAGGIGRRKFQAFLQQYFLVVKAIALTNDFAISKGKTLRKMELDEIVEVLEGPRTDEQVGVTRVKGRSLVDSLEGWITVKGNHGTPFLQEVDKPYYVCKKDVPLDKDYKSEGESGVVRGLKADEVLELVEGPRTEAVEPALRIRVKADSDGATGWITSRDKRGLVFAKADERYYRCTAPIAMTDNLDIKICKVVKKLAAGDLFVAEEGPISEANSQVTRVKGRKDDAVGWVTVRGNAGTVYAEVSSAHYTVVRETPLQKKKGSNQKGDPVRVLAAGEAVQVLEGPVEEAFPPEARIKVKVLGDGQVGWVTLQDDVLGKWSGVYRCAKAQPLLDALSRESAKPVRELEVGETLELLEGPLEEAGEIRIRAKGKDGAVGWAAVRDKDGKRLLES